MKSLVIYDSAYGNTAKVAKAIARGLGGRAVLVDDISDPMIGENDFLVFGSPTQGGRPLESITNYIESINPSVFKNIRLAVFDTRFDIHVQKLPLRMLMRTIGYAADKIAHGLETKTKNKVMSSEGFIVRDKEGPLGQGELLRAERWGNAIAQM